MRITKTLVVFAAVSALFSVQALASGDNGNAANGKTIFEQGKGAVPACNSCHGAEGLGDDSMGTPRLAGQGYVFIVKQLSDFANDKRMDTTMFTMNTNAKGLSEEDRRDVAAYVSSLDSPDTASDMKQVKELGNTVGVRYLGKALAQYGAPERDVPACHSCHGFNTRGAAPIYPRLANQRYVYLVNQLKKWRDGSRANDLMGQMRKVAKNLSDDDIYNVAAFLTSAPLTTVGNGRLPPAPHTSH